MTVSRKDAHDLALNALREKAAELHHTARDLRPFDSKTALLHERAAQKLDQWIRHFDSQHKRGNNLATVHYTAERAQVDDRLSELEADNKKWERYFQRKSKPDRWAGPYRQEDDEEW